MNDYKKGQVLRDTVDGGYVVFLNYVWDDDYRSAKIFYPECGDTGVMQEKDLRTLTKREKGEVQR